MLSSPVQIFLVPTGLPIVPMPPITLPTTSSASHSASLSFDGMPYEMQVKVCDYLDAAEIAALTSDRPELRAFLPLAMIDRASRALILKHERGDLTEWPLPMEPLRALLAEKLPAEVGACPHTKLLRNLLEASERLSSGTRPANDPGTRLPFQGNLRANNVILPPTGPAELVVSQPDSTEICLQSTEGDRRSHPSLAGKNVLGQLTSVVNAMLSRPESKLILRDHDDALGIYRVSDSTLTPLLPEHADIRSSRHIKTNMSSDADGRYVVVCTDTTDNSHRLFVYDNLTHTFVTDTQLTTQLPALTTPLPVLAGLLPITSPGVLSVHVDRKGNALVDDCSDTVEVANGTVEPISPDSDLPRFKSVLGLTPDDRYRISSDAAGIRLVHRTSGEVIMLRHPTSIHPAVEKPNCIAMSAGNAMISALYPNGTLALFNMKGIGSNASDVLPALELPLPAATSNAYKGVTWFDQDGGGVNATYYLNSNSNTVGVMHFRLVDG